MTTRSPRRAIALYCDLVSRAALDGIGRADGRGGQSTLVRWKKRRFEEALEEAPAETPAEG